MAVTRSRLSTLEISADNITYFPITKIVSATMPGGSTDADVTNHDSGAWEEHLQDRNNWSIDVECLVDEADANGQIQAYTGWIGQTVFFWRFRTRGAVSTAKQYVGQGYVKGMPIDTKNNGVAGFKFSVQGTAALTPSAQP